MSCERHVSVMCETLTGEKAASSKLSSSTALLSDSAAVNLIYITQIEWGKKRVIRSRLSEENIMRCTIY